MQFQTCSTLDILGLPDYLFGSLEKVANEHEARQMRRNRRKTKHMSTTKLSELWKMAGLTTGFVVCCRVNQVSKGKDKGETKKFDPRELYSLCCQHSGPVSEEEVESLKKSSHQAGAGGKEAPPKLQGRRRVNPKVRALAKGKA